MLRSKLIYIYPLDFHDNGMIHVHHFQILMALSTFLTLGRHQHQDRHWRAELFPKRAKSFHPDLFDTRTLKTLLANGCASIADVSCFWIVFERLSV